MMILAEGGFTSVLHNEITSRIKKAIDCGRQVILIVPEQQTLSCEAEMADILPARASELLDVTNFSRFTNTAFRTLGGIHGEYIDPACRSLLMWSVLTELSPFLNLTRGATNISTGLVEKAMRAVSEMDTLGISPEGLRSAEEELSEADRRLCAKVKDLSLIYSLYKTKLREKYSDMTEDILGLAKELGENPEYLFDKEIYIEGFTSFTEPQYKLIGSMMRATELTVSLVIPKAERESFEYSELRDTEKRLISLADRLGVTKKLTRPDARDESYDETLGEICKLLWRQEGKLDNEYLQILDNSPEKLSIFEANTPFDECDFIAADIKRRVMGGERYSDLAIVVRSLASYTGVTDSSLDKAGVPHFLSSKEPITSFEAIKLITTAYSVIARGFKSADVLTYAKCGLFRYLGEDLDLFEIYVTKWKIDGRRFTDGLYWNMNPRGYEELNDNDGSLLERINRVKTTLIEPLSALKEDTDAAKTVREEAEALFSFLTAIDLEGRILERCRELSALGEAEGANKNARLWGMICDALDTLVSMLGDMPSDADSFISRLGVIFKESSLGSLPSFVDQVMIGEADMLRLRDKKHIYLVGVNRGEFPASVKDMTYFSDRDRLTLEALGVMAGPDAILKNAREYYSFSRAFASAHESVTVLYTKKTSSLGTAQPAEIIARIGEITDGRIKPTEISSLPTERLIYSPKLALEALGKLSSNERKAVRSALSGSEYESIIKVSEVRIENDRETVGEEVMAILLGNSIYLSESKISKFKSCPFAYFAHSLLKIDEGRSAEIDAPVVGNFIHSVLEEFFNTVIASGISPAELDDGELSRLTESASRGYIRRELGDGYGSQRTEQIIKRITRTAMPIVRGLKSEFANCRFTPAACEMKISARSKYTPDPIIYTLDDSGRRIVIEGKIDRVDTLKAGEDVYVRVVDYKTGIKTFSLEDIKDGENLQMLLYLKAIVDTDNPEFKKMMGAEGGKLLPAGIVYVKTSVSDITVDTSSDEAANEKIGELYERLGASLDSEESIAAMNPDYIPKGKARGKEPAPVTYTMEDWDRLGDELKNVVLDVTGEIVRGNIPARTESRGPFSPCERCGYRYLCRSSGE